jgi:hypothetical protein
MFLERRNCARSCIACVYRCRVHTQRCEPSRSESISPLTASQWREALALRQPARRVNKLNGSCAILLRQRINHNADCAGCARSKRCCAQPGNAQHRTPRRCASQGTGNPWGLESYRDRFFGNLLRSFSRFGFQDAQTPPSPLVGEGGWGDEGQRRSLSRAFINERSGAFGQPGYDLDPVPRQIRLSVASLQSCTVANRKYSSSHRG